MYGLACQTKSGKSQQHQQQWMLQNKLLQQLQAVHSSAGSRAAPVLLSGTQVQHRQQHLARSWRAGVMQQQPVQAAAATAALGNSSAMADSSKQLAALLQQLACPAWRLEASAAAATTVQWLLQ
jgi:hypothetical protein